MALRGGVLELRGSSEGGDAPLIKSVPFLPERFVKQAGVERCGLGLMMCRGSSKL